MTIVAVVCLALAVAAVLLHFTATSWQPTIAAACGARIGMWFALPALGLALAARQWVIAALAAGAVVLGLVVQVPYYVAGAARPSGQRLTVLQANLKLGSADPAALVRMVRDDHVDLLATEELTAGEQERLVAAGLESVLPHRYTQPRPAGAGLGIWSRFPLRDPVSLPGFVHGVLHAEVVTPSGTLTFVGLHLLPPYPYPPAEWLAETARLRGVLLRLASRALVAGDFNATVDHAQFRRLLSGGYANAGAQARAGYLATYPADQWYGPLIGIDHVLTRSAVATSTRTVNLPGSDHRGLLVRVTLAR